LISSSSLPNHREVIAIGKTKRKNKAPRIMGLKNFPSVIPIINQSLFKGSSFSEKKTVVVRSKKNILIDIFIKEKRC